MSQEHDDAAGGGHGGGDAHAKKGGGHGHGGGGHGGGGGHEEGEHTGAPEWLISFADNVALLMGFFVIMLALSMAVKSKGGSGEGQGQGALPSTAELDFAIGVREAFNNPVQLNSSKPGEQPMIKRLREKKGDDATDDNAAGRFDRVQSPDRGAQYAVTAVLIFEAGQSTLSSDGQRVLSDFAERARGLRQVVEIRGHTSLGEIEGDPVAAMKLSHQRAFHTAETLASMGLPWKQMRLMSLGANERDAGEMSFPERKLRNQRVEMILTSEITRD